MGPRERRPAVSARRPDLCPRRPRPHHPGAVDRVFHALGDHDHQPATPPPPMNNGAPVDASRTPRPATCCRATAQNDPAARRRKDFRKHPTAGLKLPVWMEQTHRAGTCLANRVEAWAVGGLQPSQHAKAVRNGSQPYHRAFEQSSPAIAATLVAVRTRRSVTPSLMARAKPSTLRAVRMAVIRSPAFSGGFATGAIQDVTFVGYVAQRISQCLTRAAWCYSSTSVHRGAGTLRSL
jgi:hypothetical protein